MNDLLEVRFPFEAEIAGLAARRASAKNIEQLERAIEDLETSSNQEERIKADIEFHRILAESTDNPVFSLILDTVSGVLHAFHNLKVFHPSRTAVTVREHRAILSAIADGDEAAARDAMTNHLEGVREPADG